MGWASEEKRVAYEHSPRRVAARRAYQRERRLVTTDQQRAYMKKWYEAHREERRVYNKAWKAANRAYVERKRLAQYGLTPELFEALIIKQSGRCAICLSAVPLEIDHEHATGLVRGLLCSGCNLGLGKFKEDPLRLEAAVRYLATTAAPGSTS